jgi:hypothetical protein
MSIHLARRLLQVAHDLNICVGPYDEGDALRSQGNLGGRVAARDPKPRCLPQKATDIG